MLLDPMTRFGFELSRAERKLSASARSHHACLSPRGQQARISKAVRRIQGSLRKPVAQSFCRAEEEAVQRGNEAGPSDTEEAREARDDDVNHLSPLCIRALTSCALIKESNLTPTQGVLVSFDSDHACLKDSCNVA